jgi:hypothetical protein
LRLNNAIGKEAFEIFTTSAFSYKYVKQRKLSSNNGERRTDRKPMYESEWYSTCLC